MKILMTNDDGIESEGIFLLAESLAEAGHEVTVCAPDGNRSATSHSITLGRFYAIEKREFTQRKATYYAVGGTPADCIQVGLTFLHFSPDLIISGINNGMNIGSDVIYSGTVAGATEGALAGYPAWALSAFYQNHSSENGFLQAIDYVLTHFDSLSSMTEEFPLLNINIPGDFPIIGKKICPLGESRYDMSYEEGEKGHYRLIGTPVAQPEKNVGTDEDYIRKGYVTITPLNCDMTDRSGIRRLQKWEKS